MDNNQPELHAVPDPASNPPLPAPKRELLLLIRSPQESQIP
jgi:hypothetical protein